MIKLLVEVKEQIEIDRQVLSIQTEFKGVWQHHASINYSLNVFPSLRLGSFVHLFKECLRQRVRDLIYV